MLTTTGANNLFSGGRRARLVASPRGATGLLSGRRCGSRVALRGADELSRQSRGHHEGKRRDKRQKRSRQSAQVQNAAH
jgi:hypothetical protein